MRKSTYGSVIMRPGSKKGMTTVFIMIIAGSVMFLVISFISVSAKQAAVSYTHSVMNLAGRSILSEYDIRLKERYGLIAFYGQSEEIAEKLLNYSSYSLDDRQYVNIGDIQPDLKEHSLADRDVFEDEIKEYVVYNLTGLISSSKDRGSVKTGERVLRNSEIISNLPSAAYEGESAYTDVTDTIKKLSSISDLFKAGTMDYYTNLYIFSCFYTGQSTDFNDDSFFRNEVEYIIEGQKSDSANVRRIRLKVVSLRTALNLAYLAKDKASQAAALAAAELITPGPEAEITKAVILAAWAAFEAENDWSILTDGGKVPLFKDSTTWASDISDVTEPQDVTGKRTPQVSRGLYYDEYLMILLTGIKDEIKYARMMDLIEINMRGTYWGNFKLKNFYTGFSFKADINGRNHEYEETY